MSLSPGTMVADKYRIERLIGAGGMGTVYEATNVKLDKRVALKMLNESASLDLAERFLKEARAASGVKHAGVVVVYDADTDEGKPWIAMELLEGESLRARLEKGKIARDEALDIVEEALGALAAVHEAGIVHRDLKPDNIFLEKTAGEGHRVKLLDFGIAKILVDKIGQGTVTSTVMGTPHYLAPEQARNAKKVGPTADVYGIGVVLYELVSGKLPYEAESFGELVEKMVKDDRRPLKDVAEDAPPALAALIDRCLSTKPDERPADAKALLAELRAARSGAPVAKTVQLSPEEIEKATAKAKAKQKKKKKKEREKALGRTTGAPDVAKRDKPPKPPPRETDPKDPFTTIVLSVVSGVGALSFVAWVYVMATDSDAPAQTNDTVVVNDEPGTEPIEHSMTAPPDVSAPPANAQRTASGLATRVLRRGTGTVHPTPADSVEVHYTGWRSANGEMFDSSRTNGRPATFPVRGVIPGFSEGLQLMVEGEERRLWIPARLAYEGQPQAPQGMLVFDVELIHIRH